VGGLECSTAGDTPRQITPVLIQGGSRSGVTTLVDGKGAQPHGLQARSKHRIPRFEGELTLSSLMG
jgi:hypothetical protein